MINAITINITARVFPYSPQYPTKIKTRISIHSAHFCSKDLLHALEWKNVLKLNEKRWSGTFSRVNGKNVCNRFTETSIAFVRVHGRRNVARNNHQKRSFNYITFASVVFPSFVSFAQRILRNGIAFPPFNRAMKEQTFCSIPEPSSF